MNTLDEAKSNLDDALVRHKKAADELTFASNRLTEKKAQLKTSISKAKTSVARLEKLSDMLKRHKEIFPKVAFNMCTWVNSTSNMYPDARAKAKKPQHCGTAACALGSAALYPPFMKQGLKMKGRQGSQNPAFDGFLNYLAGAEFFGITGDQSFDLFNPGKYAASHDSDPEKVTPRMVAKKVDAIIKQKKAELKPFLPKKK